MQKAIALEGAAAGMSMEWDAVGDVKSLWGTLSELVEDHLVIGLGSPLLAAVGASVEGLQPFPALVRGRYTMPATQHGLWALVLGADAGTVFENAERIAQRLAPLARLAEATSLFSYRRGHDLSGYKDGSANPTGDAALEAALIADGPWTGASFAMVQRWLHFRDRFHGLTQAERDFVVGRRQQGDDEIENAPITAHVKRADQEGFDSPTFILRRSMPWGTVRRHGLQFLAFTSDLAKATRLLNRMMGIPDGHQDALLGHAQAETGSFYFVPPVAKGRLVLPEAHFEGQLTTPPNVEVVESKSVRLIVDSRKCIHSRQCVLARPDVFVPNVVGPWLHPELATADEIAEIAHSCPSGAITYERLDGGPQEKPRFRNVIRIRENGPIAIHGEFSVGGEAQMRAALCRCGRSERKPYCDGSHAKVGFTASGEAVTLTELPNGATPRKVTIQPMPDGPLVVHGAPDVVTGTGRAITSSAGPNLCRCGNSANKPFCDGSHARVGFTAPG